MKSIQLLNANGAGTIALLPWQNNNVTDFLIIPTKSVALLPGKRYRLDIKFAGVLGEGLRGFLRGRSVDRSAHFLNFC